MTVDEAIQNQEELIKSCEEKINDVKFLSKTRIGRDIIDIQSEYIQEYKQYIEWLQDYKRLLNIEKQDKYIKALEQPILDNIRAEIEHLHDWAFSREEILRIIDKYKAESEE